MSPREIVIVLDWFAARDCVNAHRRLPLALLFFGLPVSSQIDRAAMRADVRGSRLFSHVSARLVMGTNVTRVADYAPKRLPSRRWISIRSSCNHNLRGRGRRRLRL